jgi:hypothetical protein
MNAPQYDHDCSSCRFLGRLSHADLYVCDKGGNGRCYILRYGNDGPEYASRTDYANRVFDRIRRSFLRWDESNRPLVERMVLIELLTLHVAQLVEGAMETVASDPDV